MTGQMKENFLELLKQVQSEMTNDKIIMTVVCSVQGSKMLDDLVDWHEEVSENDEVSFNTISGHIKDTEIPVMISKSATISEYHISIRMIPEHDPKFKYLSEWKLSNKQENIENIEKIDLGVPPITV